MIKNLRKGKFVEQKGNNSANNRAITQNNSAKVRKIPESC